MASPAEQKAVNENRERIRKERILFRKRYSQGQTPLSEQVEELRARVEQLESGSA